MKKVLALIVLCFIAFNSHAQLKYQNGYLVYNAMERYNGYMTNWEGWAHCWKFGNRMIKFDLGPADSRVSSNSDKLVLYDTENGGFIDLYARNVYTLRRCVENKYPVVRQRNGNPHATASRVVRMGR